MELTKRFQKIQINFVLICLLGLVSAVPASAQQGVIDTAEFNDVSLILGELVTLKVHALTRISISDPSVADVVEAEADKLLVVGKNVGSTAFFIWDEKGKRTVFVRVFEEDMNMIKFRIEKLLRTLDLHRYVKIEINTFEGKIIITGAIPQHKMTHYRQVVEPFAEVIMDMVEEGISEELIQIDAQIAELNDTLLKNMGIEWTTGSNDGIILSFPEAPPSFNTETERQLERLYKLGTFSRSSSSTLLATVNFLITQGKGRILSKPSLVVVSGSEASFNVGGQIPIRTSTSSGTGTTQENVTFKDFGIIMSVTPTVREDKIEITLNIEVSDVDASLPASSDVGFSTRSAQTEVLLDDRQTIVIAGLIKQTQSESVQKVPFLGDVPIIGTLFRSRSNPAANKDTELVISLKPTILNREELEALDKAEMTQKERKIRDDELMDLPDDEDEMAGEIIEADELSEEASEDDMDEVDTEMEEDMEMSEDESDEAEELADDETMEKEGDQAKDKNIIFENVLGEIPDVSKALTKYVQLIQKKISQAISYPYKAIEEGWEGTVKLSLRILKDGSLDEVTIKESSGHTIFDKDALNTAQILAPFAAFPPDLDLEEIIVTIPIVYSQDAASLDVACHVELKAEELAKAYVGNGKPYAQIVKETIAKSAIYPQEARKHGWEGTVKLNLEINRDGTLALAKVKESSGYRMFDDCALRTAQGVAPFSDFPADSNLQTLNVTIPINYSLKN